VVDLDGSKSEDKSARCDIVRLLPLLAALGRGFEDPLSPFVLLPFCSANSLSEFNIPSDIGGDEASLLCFLMNVPLISV